MIDKKWDLVFEEYMAKYPALGAKKHPFKQALKICFEATPSHALLHWFAAAYIQFFINNSQEDISLKKLEPLTLDECTLLTSLEKSNNHTIDNEQTKTQLDKLVVIKLNGGLGTSMGCRGPKSLVNLDKQHRFIDMIYAQKKSFQDRYKLDMPFYLMNSFQTAAYKQDYHSSFTCFEQHKIPRISMDTGACFADATEAFTPPGHGNIFLTLAESGLLDTWLAQGKTYMFISNSDNLGATVHPDILNYLDSQGLDCVMEVTQKTALDIKGGALCKENKRITLCERAQINESERSLFEDINVFSLFNTNNLWFRIDAIKKALEKNALTLPLIVNKKTINNQHIVQFETAMGAAISSLSSSACLVVPRDRFFPVKTTADLMLLRSSLIHYNNDGTLTKLSNHALPEITLSSHYKNVADFDRYMKVVPDINDLKTLSIDGPFVFEENVSLTGNVQLKNITNEPVVLKNKTLKG